MYKKKKVKSRRPRCLIRGLCKRQNSQLVNERNVFSPASVKDLIKGRIHNLLMNEMSFLLPQLEDFV